MNLLQLRRETARTPPGTRREGPRRRSAQFRGTRGEPRGGAKTGRGGAARRAPASVLVGRGGRFFKRCVDVTTALLVGIPTLPLLGALLVMIRLDSPGPSVYSCQRVGTGGRPFKCYKVRSMYSD